MRTPMQGIWNIIRFNWHFYLMAFGLLLVLSLMALSLSQPLALYLNVLSILLISTTFLSLVVSYYIYDFSSLYKLEWLNGLGINDKGTIVNLHAGFDETSVLLKAIFGGASFMIFDFYDPSKHTEVSIKRARKAYPPSPNTISVQTTRLPLADHSVDILFVIFAAHEVRHQEERIAFFKELNRVIKPTGQIIVTEHLRDRANFLAYNIGFFHFYSRATWQRTFEASALSIQKEVKITPFISTFLLQKNGASS